GYILARDAGVDAVKREKAFLHPKHTLRSHNAAQIAGGSDEIDLLRENLAVMVRTPQHDALGHRHDGRRATATGKTHRGPVGVADEAGVDAASRVDLGHAEE